MLIPHGVVQLALRVTVAPGARKGVVSAFHTIMRLARCEANCLDAHLARETERPERFWYFEYWGSQRDFEARVQSEQFTRLLALVETSAAPPLVECRLIAEARGLDYIASVRGLATRSPDDVEEDGEGPFAGGTPRF